MATDKKIDLVFNVLSQGKYDELCQNDQLNENELYLVKEDESNGLKGDSKKLYSEDEQKYIDGDGNVFEFKCDKQTVPIIECISDDEHDRYKGLIFVCTNPDFQGGDPDGTTWNAINSTDGNEYTLQFNSWHDEYWDCWGDYIDTYEPEIVEHDGKFYSAILDGEVYRYSDQSFDSIEEAYDCTYWHYSWTDEDDNEFEAEHMYYSDYYNDSTLLQNGEWMGSGDFYENYNFYVWADYDLSFEWSSGPYGKDILGTESWRKVDEVQLKSESPKRVSELENDSGFIEQNQFSSQINTINNKLNGIYYSSISKSSGTITTLTSTNVNSTNVSASSSMKVGGKNVSVDGHKHTTSDITGLSIPTKTSQLTNDSGYVKSSDISIPTKVSELENDSTYLTKDDLDEIEFDELSAESITLNGISIDDYILQKMTENGKCVIIRTWN